MSDFVGPNYDTNHSYTPETGAVIMDGARANTQVGSAYLEAEFYVKFCLGCPHWARAHPDHGRCLMFIVNGRWRGPAVPCSCPGFVDPLPGRPDRVLTRVQVDRMLRWRWELVKNKLYLLKDGTYGVWDRWSSPEWLAEPSKGREPDSSRS
jgi:hypothetical protein